MRNCTDIALEICSCDKCPLSKLRTHAVPGDGNVNAKIMFIGEGPGKKEDEIGKPFVGAAGKFLSEMLGTIGLKREDVFITNVVKCRPPNNRDPEQNEVDQCYPYLKEQVAQIQPKLIILLGKHAMYRFLPKELKISQVHGKPMRYKGISTEQQVYLPLYHPAVALYNGSYRELLKKDFAQIPHILNQIV